MLGIVAQTLMEFDDSHTYLVPPPPADQVQHGWELQMVGDACYVTYVKPGADAEKKGLKAGDVVRSFNGYGPTRENLWKMQYYYFVLNPCRGNVS